MNTQTTTESGMGMLEAWTALSAAILGETGAISLRFVSVADAPLDVSGAYGEDLNLDPLQRASIESFVATLAEGENFKCYDTLTVDSGYIIGTITQNSHEFDKSIYRTSQTLGCYFESDDGLILLEDGSQSDMGVPTADGRYYTRDAVKVHVFGKYGETPVTMTYTGSFDMNVADIPSDMSVLLEDDEDEDARLVCDLHEAADGLRSITITRDAMTPDGPSRRIVYSDLIH